MIASLTGTVDHIFTDSILLNVNGVGYQVFVLPTLLTEINPENEMTIYTYLHVREDEMSLYGFKTQRELAFFKLLLQAPGIGPKSGLNVMSVATIDTLIRAITSGDMTLLTKVSGIGKKIAERIIVELKTKLEKQHPEISGQGATVHGDVIAALTSLGYSPIAAREVVRQLPSEIKNAEEGIRMALKVIGSKAER